MPTKAEQCLRRWVRMAHRAAARAMWHISGLLLWVLRRLDDPCCAMCHIRTLQLGTQSNVGAAGRDDDGESWTKRHLARAKQLQALTAQNLANARWLRDRLGWEHSFVEGSMLLGMLSARSSKKFSAKIKAAALAESQQEADKNAAQGKQEEAVRSLLEPSWRGGVAQRRFDQAMPPAPFERGFKRHGGHPEGEDQTHVGHFEGQPGRQVQSKGQASPDTAAPASSLPTPSRSARDLQQARVTMADVNNLLGQEEERFQSMLSQTLQHMMSSMSMPMQPQMPPGQNQTVAPGYGSGQWTDWWPMP